MIFTPRSCPSSPGFATSTRIFFSVILRCALCVSVTSVFRFRSFASSQDISPYSFFQDWDVEIDEEAKPTVSQEKTRQRDGLVDGSRSAASGGRALTDSASCRWSSRDGDFFVGANDRAHGVADVAQRGVGFDSLVDVWHQVLGAFGGLAQRRQAPFDFIARPLGAQLVQSLGLAKRSALIDVQDFDVFFICCELVHRANVF